MKKLITVALNLMLLVGLSGLAVAGSLDSPGAPSAGSGMYTLQNLYDYLTSGTALTVQTGFQEPTSGPGSTMKTTKEIGNAIKALLEQSEISAADVAQGKKFICTQPGSWGIQTGTALLMPTPTATPTITSTPTQTPTPTPTVWDSAACTSNGGYWALDGLGGSGCWFLASDRQTCTDACATKNLSCSSAYWNDNSSCSICKHFYPAGICDVHAWVGWDEIRPFVASPYSGDHCRSNAGSLQNCDAWRGDGGTTKIYRLCICH
ncbi:MAG: hypothetical protein NTZ78_13805 [Candidatus Aureabacteria bacterium]|nr:hypothetical protein [Candidatus Auribacterota bacterium]